MEPAGLGNLLNKSQLIQSGDAKYVICMRTSVLLGSLHLRCYCNIIVESELLRMKAITNFFGVNHIKAIEINNFVNARRYGFIASKKGKGIANLGADECLIGSHEKKIGDYRILIPDYIFEEFYTSY